MARLMFAALAGATLLASPVLATDTVRPSVASVQLQPASMLAGARMSAQISGKKRSDMAPAAVGAVLAGLVAVGAGVGIATSSGGGNGSTSP
ncbi:hypothetical protein HZF05_03365 [Sphingomonas sp. CGMCC 1.13654]|uniref:Uncharacterized protein n=1 Tax=Sphingomonas chungangi TaxID=2683589 RepID=A0A838L3Z0_9SPHN|nr:hypothetical protein [Sphingomonas chungangi]MBA2933129.1 hypothetical protein [Sphingomonas chungangi]MVW56749.1 hypothetical protein [Sphingomonas chungangi]